jgi:hypothetical protein
MTKHKVKCTSFDCGALCWKNPAYKGKSILCQTHLQQKRDKSAAPTATADSALAKPADDSPKVKVEKADEDSELACDSKTDEDTEHEPDDDQGDKSEDAIQALLEAVPAARKYFDELLLAAKLMDPPVTIADLCRRLKADRDEGGSVYRDVKKYRKRPTRDWGLSTVTLDGVADITREVMPNRDPNSCKYFEAPAARAILIEWPAELNRATYLFQWAEGTDGHSVLSRQTLIVRLRIFVANIDLLPRVALWEDLALDQMATAQQEAFLEQVTKAEQCRLSAEGESGADCYEDRQSMKADSGAAMGFHCVTCKKGWLTTELAKECPATGPHAVILGELPDKQAINPVVGEIKLVEYTGYCLRVYHHDQRRYADAVQKLVNNPDTLREEGAAFRQSYSDRPHVVAHPAPETPEPPPAEQPAMGGPATATEGPDELEAEDASASASDGEENEELELGDLQEGDRVEIVAETSPQKGGVYRVSKVGTDAAGNLTGKVRLLTLLPNDATDDTPSTTPSGKPENLVRAGWYFATPSVLERVPGGMAAP